MIRKFGRLGMVAERARRGKASDYEMNYILQQPDWILKNSSLCTLFGNIAPLVVISGIVLLFL